MSPQLEPVAELETLKTHVDNSGTAEASKLSPTGSTRKENEHHHEEHSHHKKSLFSKMKDKAKKLQHSLSGKRRHDEEGSDATMSPPFGRSEDHQVREAAGGYATLSPRDKSKDHKGREEGEVEEEHPEYLGAPMYESKKAPEELKETARQHPRETPVITETNVLSVLPAKQEVINSPSKTLTETVTETLAPAYAKVSEATHAITKKIQDMAFPESTDTEPKTNGVSESNTAGTNQQAGFNSKVWDKGVSVKEYISQKFEPGEDDRALSQVITKAISPRKASSQASTFGGATNMVSASNSADNKGPLLANTSEIVEEENHGKMLQPN
ncbi:Low-temperature-induced protein [Hirschfeldia incana]|nr:Low-temperature-induced protein [Hirschfeldia incana]